MVRAALVGRPAGGQRDSLTIWPEADTVTLRWRRRVVVFRSVNTDSEPVRVLLTVPGLQDRMRMAFRRWLRAGGVPLLRRVGRRRKAEAGRLRRMKRQRELEAAQSGLRHFLNGQSCSGGVVPSVPAEDRVLLELAPRAKRPRQQASREWEDGLRADRYGRFRVSL